MVVLSRCFPENIDSAVYGIFQRFRSLLHSICAISKEVHVVFFVDKNIIDKTDVIVFKKNIHDKWGVDITPLLCSTEKFVGNNNFKDGFFSAFSMDRLELFAPCSGETQSSFVESKIAGDTDLIFVHRLNSYFPVFAINSKLPPIAFDLDDVEHKKWFRDLSLPPFWFGKLVYYLHLPLLFFGEMRAVRRSAITFVCSDKDRRYLNIINPNVNVRVLPNSVDFPDKPSSRRRPNVLLFVGTYTYFPNVEAAERLINRIFPLIKIGAPEAELWLVGNKIENIPSFGSNIQSVKYLGFVESLESIYDEASIVCCPIRSGGGTRIKIIEAAAFGLPIVSTRVGAEGLDFENGKEIIIESDDKRFAGACVSLLNSYDDGVNIGLNARKLARKYGRDNFIHIAKEFLKSIAAH